MLKLGDGMELIADGLLIATALIAGLYCLVLSRRLRRLTDSGAGLGSQIEALDRAMGETRAALTETREGVAELRASARAATADLKRRSESAEALAARLGETAGRAEATLARLYAAEDRIEAHERREARPAGAAEDGDVGGRRATGESVILDAVPGAGAAPSLGDGEVEAPGRTARKGNGAVTEGAAAGRRQHGAGRRGKNGKGTT